MSSSTAEVERSAGVAGGGGWSRRTVLLRLAATAALSTLGTIYFLSAALAAGPITPLSLKYGGHALHVLDPYLSQNWQLFAPTPISEERGVVARAQCGDGSVTEYRDITTPLVEEVQSTRFFPSRKSRIVSNGMFGLFQEHPYLARVRDAAEDRRPTLDSSSSTSSQDEQLIPLTEEELLSREDAEALLAGLSARSFAGSCDGTPRAVQMRYVLHAFPRWSERSSWDSTGIVQTLQSRWIMVS